MGGGGSISRGEPLLEELALEGLPEPESSLEGDESALEPGLELLDESHELSPLPPPPPSPGECTSS